MELLKTKIIVLISEVSLFQVENKNEFGIQSGVLTGCLYFTGVLISGVSFKKGPL